MNGNTQQPVGSPKKYVIMKLDLLFIRPSSYQCFQTIPSKWPNTPSAEYWQLEIATWQRNIAINCIILDVDILI